MKMVRRDPIRPEYEEVQAAESRLRMAAQRAADTMLPVVHGNDVYVDAGEAWARKDALVSATMDMYNLLDRVAGVPEEGF